MVSYKQHSLDDRWDAIVIGSGIGGLTAAAMLSKYASRKVLVLERHYTAGGYTHSFTRPGYCLGRGRALCRRSAGSELRRCARPSTILRAAHSSGRPCPMYMIA